MIILIIILTDYDHDYDQHGDHYDEGIVDGHDDQDAAYQVCLPKSEQ